MSERLLEQGMKPVDKRDVRNPESRVALRHLFVAPRAFVRRFPTITTLDAIDPQGGGKWRMDLSSRDPEDLARLKDLEIRRFPIGLPDQVWASQSYKLWLLRPTESEPLGIVTAGDNVEVERVEAYAALITRLLSGTTRQ